METRKAGGLLSCQALSEAHALTILGWEYPEPYAAYNMGPASPEEVRRLLDPARGYYGLLQKPDQLVAYLCLGADARVAGWAYDDSALDLGMGLRPDLVGRGWGLECLRAALGFIGQRGSPARVRATVAVWNKRALGLCRKTRFREVAAFGGFRREGGGPYVVLVTELA